MKKVILVLLLCFGFGVNCFALDLIDLGTSAVIGISKVGKPNATQKKELEKEFEKEREATIIEYDRRSKLCMRLFEIVNSYDEAKAMQIVEDDKDLKEYVELLKFDEKESARCENLQEREIKAIELAQKENKALIDNTSSLYHLLEL